MDNKDPLEFINLLKSQHKTIITAVYEIDNQRGGPSDLKSSIEKLNKITDILFDHLELEDKQLYPTLLANNDTCHLAKKYSYDMERLSCIALDFFKRYCVNREKLKIFLEDFVNTYSIFKGLLKVRIKREETELYPAFILLQSGVLHSEVVSYMHEQESKIRTKQKAVFVFGENQASLDALVLTLEICGYQVGSTCDLNQVFSLTQTLSSDLILLDVSKTSKGLNDLIKHLREQCKQGVQLIGYSTTAASTIEDTLNTSLDDYIPRAALDIEEFSTRIKQRLATAH